MLVASALVGLASGCTRVSERQRFNGNPDTLEIVRTVPESRTLVDPDVQGLGDFCHALFQTKEFVHVR